VSDQILFVIAISLIFGVVAALLWFMARSARRNASRPSWVASAGWVLLFLTSGRMPPPPPASQIEVELNGEKDRLGSRTIDPTDEAPGK
jgi:hypothetical protein